VTEAPGAPAAPAELRDRYRGVPVLVTGGTGFIGRWVARALTAAGSRLHVVVRDEGVAAAMLRGWNIAGAPIVADLADPAGVATVVTRTRPAIVFNLAGYGVDPAERDEALATRLNAALPGQLAAAFVPDPDWTGQHVVHAGTALEYGAAGGDLAESTSSAPTTWYGRSKLAGTQRLAQTAGGRGLRTVTARLFTVYGPGEHEGRLLPSLLAAARSDAALPLTAGLQQRDFTYVADVAEGLLRLGVLGQGELGAVNLATGRLTSVREFVETAARTLRISAERLRFGALPTRPEEMRHGPVNIGRLRALAGWVPTTTIDEGIARTAQFVARV